jgi:glycosyltransferase involved in cell wall biosynthesis
MRIVSLTYINSPGFNQPLDWIERLYAFTGVFEELSKEHTVFCIEQINYSGDLLHKGVQYHFRNYGNGVNRFPFQLHRFVKQLNPDIVIVRGLHFPLQLIQLRHALGMKARIVVENHFDRAPKGIKKIIQKVASRSIDAYHFISAGNAQEWIDSGIIRKKKLVEIPAGSARLQPADKEESKRKLGLTGTINFLWVGSLSKRKDPLTVITAFEKYLYMHSGAKLYMVYQSGELLPEIKKKMESNPLLVNGVVLKGHISNEDLGAWYSAADFYISGSHGEGGSIAIMEAMACGCIPVVTAIPSAMAVTANGKYGFHFQPGNIDDLYKQLLYINALPVNEFSKQVKDHFRKELSFEGIARKFIRSCNQSILKLK